MRSGKWDTVGGSLAIAGTIAFVLGMLWVMPAFAADKNKQGKIADSFTDIADTKSKWTGCHIGVVGSYDRQSTEVTGNAFDSGTYSASDFGYGVQTGCDIRLPSSSIVLGAMADYMWSRNESALAEYDRSWSIVARGGLLLSDTTLLYVLAGYTSLDGKFDIPTDVKIGLPDSGLTLGAGVETFVFKNLTLNAEYRVIDMGDSSGTRDFLWLDLPVNAESYIHQIRVGARYRF